MPLSSQGFGAVLDVCARFGFFAIFSLSKAVPLAAARLGGLLALPGNIPVPQGAPLTWDVFQCAVLDVVLSGNLLLDLAEAQDQFQTAIHQRVVAAVRALGIDLHYVENPLFVTARRHASRFLPGNIAVKQYPRLELDRISSSPGNLRVLERHLTLVAEGAR
jgi:hypothetical protein